MSTKKIDVAGELNSATTEGIIADSKQIRFGDGKLTDSINLVDNPEYLYAVTDAEDRLLFAIKAEDGKPYFPKNETYNVVSSPEYIVAWVDGNDKLLFGIRVDGSFYVAKAEFLDKLNEIETVINESGINIGEINNELEEIKGNITSIQSDVTELSDRVNDLEENQGGGSIVESEYFSTIDDPEGRIEITTDKDEKVLSYRTDDGINHEVVGFDSPKYYQNGEEKDWVERSEVSDEVTKATENGAVKLENVGGISNHNTPNLLIADEMEKTFSDGTNSFTPPNAGYEMSNRIECKAGDWFTRTGTATGMVVVTNSEDKNGTRLFNADGTTLPNTFQVPENMTWVKYIRMAADTVGAEDGSVVICKGKEAYTSENRGDFLTVDKLRIQTANIPKDIRYLKSSDGKYWEMYVDDSHKLQIREIDPDIITDLPADFPVYTISGDYGEYFDTWVSMVQPYLVERNVNGVVKYHKLGSNAAYYADFRKEKSLSSEIRYIVNVGGAYQGENGEKYLTIYDENFKLIDTNIYPCDAHDFVYFDDNHVAVFVARSKSDVNVPVDKDKSDYVKLNHALSASIIELKKVGEKWEELATFNMYDYPELLTDEFGIYSELEVLEVHPNTLFLDYDGNYVLNIRNNDSWIKVRRTENHDGTVTIGSKTLDYDEAIIGRVGGKYNSGYIDPKRVLEEGFSFTDVPTSLHTRSTDEVPVWKFYHEHDIAYWGMKNIGGQNYPTYTLFDNNMWTGNIADTNYIDINPRNNYTNNPNGNNDHFFIEDHSDDGGSYDTNMVSRVVQLSIDWENHLIKDYRVYIIPKQYSYTRSGAQMFDEGVLLISWADQKICGLYDFNDEQTEVENHVYKNGKELFKASVNTTSFYRVHGYKNN